MKEIKKNEIFFCVILEKDGEQYPIKRFPKGKWQKALRYVYLVQNRRSRTNKARKASPEKVYLIKYSTLHVDIFKDKVDKET